MNTKALQLLSRFSLSPNALGYCGKDSAPAKFLGCIATGNCEQVTAEIPHFIVLHPYLKTLAQISNKIMFDYEVIEAYWLGNDLLERAKLEDYSLLLENFKAQGVPENLLEELAHKQPKAFIPNHLFQVLHVGVGRSSGAVTFNIESINNCMIRWGKVTEVQDNIIKTDLNSLMQSTEGKHELTVIPEELTVDKRLIEEVTPKKVVAVHWGVVVKVLTQDEAHKLRFWTERVLTTNF